MNTAALRDLIDRLPDGVTLSEAVEEMAKENPALWCMLYRRLRGRPLIFDNSRALTPAVLAKLVKECRPDRYEFELKMRLLRHRPFLLQPLADQHPHKVYEKGRQVGVSELSLIEVIHFLWSHPGTKAIVCVPDEAEILTRRGWRKWYEVTTADQTLALDPVTHVSRWEPILELKSFAFEGVLPAVGPFHCTDNHRWPVVSRNQQRRPEDYVRKIVLANEIKSNHRLIRMAPHEHNGSVSALTPRLAAILGWVVTDGHQWLTGSTRGKNTVMMNVSQSKPENLRPLERLLRMQRTRPIQRMAHHLVNWTFRVHRDDIRAILATGYRTKADLPGLVTRLSQEAALAMWQAMMAAEGCPSGPTRMYKGRTGRSQFFAQNLGPVLDAFQILCALTGQAANIMRRTPCAGHTTADGRHIRHTQAWSGAYVIRPDSKAARIKPSDHKLEAEYYRGIVWCPRTPSGTWYMRYRGKVVFTGNTFPRDKQLEQFATTRINTAFNESTRMQSLLGVPNQVYTKRIGDSFLILRSAWEANLGEGVDADLIVLDEKDRMREHVDVAFRESLKSSNYGLFREVSTPTLPGRGIDASFRDSDQLTWLVRCTRCNLEQEVAYPDNVVQVKDIPLGAKELPEDSYEYQCRRTKCRGLLDRMKGRWVVKYPTRKLIRGYHMPQTIAPWISATQIMQDKIRYKFLQLWQNYVLAMPTLGENILLSEQDFNRIAAGHQFQYVRSSAWQDISAGIDWGNENWLVVTARNVHNQRFYVLLVALVVDRDSEPLYAAKEMVRILKPLDPDITCADAGYGKDRNAHLLKTLGKGKFYACLDEHTKVATLDQQGWKYIKDMQVGDWTYAWNGERVEPTQVTKVHKNGRKPVVRVVCKDASHREKTILCTPDHVFPLRLGGKRRADKLRPGDRLVPFGRWMTGHEASQGASDQDATVNHMVVRVEPAGSANVYDLTVAHDAHNYAVYDGVFVKNCWYNPSVKASRTFQPVWSAPEQARALVDRTMTLKTICHTIREREFGLPDLSYDIMQLYMKHFTNLAPIHTEEDGELVEEIASTGPDHLAHAQAYSWLGLTKLCEVSPFGWSFL
jgi:hypothetical protein